MPGFGEGEQGVGVGQGSVRWSVEPCWYAGMEQLMATGLLLASDLVWGHC